jgi:hypothetical protein
MGFWLQACKEYASTTGKWIVPKKGSSEYDAIKKIQDRLSAASVPDVVKAVMPAPGALRKAKVVPPETVVEPVVPVIKKPKKEPVVRVKQPKPEPVQQEPVKAVKKQPKIVVLDTPAEVLAPVPQPRAAPRKKLQKARPVNVTKEPQIIEFN